MIRKLLLAIVAAVPAFAQIQLLQVDGTTETPVGTLYQLPAVAPGDSLETRFRVKNTGTGPVTLQTLTIKGTGFSLSSAPAANYVIAPTLSVDFRVLFTAGGAGNYSAPMQVNNLAVSVRCSVAASASVFAGTARLTAGSTVDMGKILRGTTVTQAFTLQNNTSAPITVAAIALKGAGFQISGGLAGPLTLDPSQSVPFQIVFAPQTAGNFAATLTIDQRVFNLIGAGLDPPLPKASIQFESPAVVSAQQTSLSIQLAAVSQVSATGTLAMKFTPSVTGGAPDPAVGFLSGPKTAATIAISPGDSLGRSGSATKIAFQTGTTAGTLAFVLTFPNGTAQASLTINPAAVGIGSATGVGRTGALDVSLIGFDNSYSASQLKFTFYDPSGQVVAPGAISFDATQDFKQYFATAQAGGAFALLARFPVNSTGVLTCSSGGGRQVCPANTSGGLVLGGLLNGSSACISGESWGIQPDAIWVDHGCKAQFQFQTPFQISGVDVEISNSVGTTKTQRISF